MEIAALYQLYLQYPSVVTDTRQLKPGDLFFALKGEHFNGNLFAQQALDAGAAYAIVDEMDANSSTNNHRLIVVADVLTTLQQLAQCHRQQFNIPVIAITGSNGKTTTKELLHEVLRSQYITYTTKGNLNNHIGIPLTLLRIGLDAQIAIVEMGANHQKEIESYCTYTLPTHGLITNCGKAHLEGFGGVEGIKKGKGELFDYLRAHKGTAFIMQDYDYLQNMSKGIKEVISYGTSDAQVVGLAATNNQFLSVSIEHGFQQPFSISTQLVGEYNLPNVLAAVTVGRHFNVPVDKIQQALQEYAPSNSRSQLIEKDGNQIILDAYNANPSSMQLAIDNFANLPGTNKVLLLGGMMELGEDSLKEHQQILDQIATHQWKAVVLVGGDFRRLTHPYPYIYFNNAADAGAWLKAQAFEKHQLLIKGSRSMQMEKVLQ